VADADIHPIGELHRKGPFGSRTAVAPNFCGDQSQYGTGGRLHALVRGAHQHGMKLIIDMVATTSWNSVMMRDPAF